MLRVPLTVRLSSAAADKHVTVRLRDLIFRSVIPGGYAEATLVFDQPLSVNDPAVALYGKVYVYDGRTGQVVWEGRQEDPGRGATADGQTWTLQAFGPAAHAGDRYITACYVENGIESFQPSNLSSIKGANVSATDDSPPLLQIALPNGLVVGIGNAAAVSRLLADTGQNVGRFSVSWGAGVTDANYQVLTRYRATPGGSTTTVGTASLNTAGGTLTARVTADIPTGNPIVVIALHPTVAGTVADENHWITAQVVLQGTRYTATGTELTAASNYTSDTVAASDVVADLLGRALSQYDGATASITSTSYAIDRLVYLDPTTPAQILDDLMQLESAYYWAAWESTANGKARFEWSSWPSTVRYEASITGDFDSPGATGDLYNAVLVRYRDSNGRSRYVRRTLAQTDLDNAGLTREGFLDLGDNTGSAAGAARAGDRFLADHNSPPNAGTLEINSPILDLITGRIVQPWEVLPGNLIRVRGVLPRVNALNATDRDAVTVFRMTATEYRAATNSCSVELDSYSRTLANQVLAAHQRITRLRKR
ncbi:MAG TPA: hypothetical protein VFH54_06170 [Mycobacteriales bacterium]|nr:hypothetical protein [Mycobacteriales bacterium]